MAYERGDYIKVEFPGEAGMPGEWLWVRGHHRDDDKQLVFGTLDNEPVNVNRLSDSTYNQLGASSPLWKELFSRGFIFRAILDKDRTLKVAKITGRGGFGSSISELPDEDRSSLEQTVYALAAAEGKE